MPSKTRPYEPFGPYVLFKKLESDPLGELWRAARIDDRHLGPLIALRRLTGGNRPVLLQNADDARAVVAQLDAAPFVKGQVVDIIDGVPFVAHEYAGGRSLRHIVDRARGGSGITPNPIPIDQAILIAERIALSLQTLHELKLGGSRLMHGALIPQFVWISEDGDVRVAGQRLGKGLIASLKDAKVAAAIGRYISPEYQHSGEPAKASEVFSLGAIFFLLMTGHEPPDAASVSAFGMSIRAAKTMAGQPLPDDIRAILEKSLAVDPARRFESAGDMKQALAALANSGKYSATTFNLAFYLNTLLKKELEGEALDRDKESRVNIVPYLEAMLANPAPAAAPAEKQSRAKPLVPIAAVIALAALTGSAYFLMKPEAKPVIRDGPIMPAALRNRHPAVNLRQLSAPITQVTPAQTAAVDPAAEKKAFEAAVNQKLQEEMAKLQAQFNKQQQQPKPPAEPRPVPTASAAQPPRTQPTADDRAPSTSLDVQTLAARQPQLQPAPTQTVSPPPQPQPAAPAVQTPAAPAPAPAAATPQPPAVREGDLVNFEELDVRPRPLSSPNLIYPPLARRENIEASLILTVLVSETGSVLDVKVLRGDRRFGFEDEAIRALRTLRFSPAMKNGKRVRTWVPQPIQFKLQ